MATRILVFFTVMFFATGAFAKLPSFDYQESKNLYMKLTQDKQILIAKKDIKTLKMKKKAKKIRTEREREKYKKHLEERRNKARNKPAVQPKQIIIINESEEPEEEENVLEEH